MANKSSSIVSVIIPVFNREKYLGRCLRSIISQSFDANNFEIIVIDDGSTDQTEKIIHAFKEDIKVISLKKNYGLSKAINEGIKNSRGDYIVRLDSDDYVNKEFLNFLFHYIYLNKDCDAVSCDYYTVDENQKIISKENCLEKPIACGIMFKKKHLIEMGLYNEKIKIYEEIDMRSRFLQKYNIERLKIPLYRYRKHSESLTS